MSNAPSNTVSLDVNALTDRQLLLVIYQTLQGMEMNESDLQTALDGVTATITSDNATITAAIAALNTEITTINAQVSALQAAAANPLVSDALAASATNLQSAVTALSAIVPAPSPAPAPAPAPASGS